MNGAVDVDSTDPQRPLLGGVTKTLSNFLAWDVGVCETTNTGNKLFPDIHKSGGSSGINIKLSVLEKVRPG